ncbi:sex hormone-binding globulin isoform X2 [Hyperolius riggenbachi]
MEFSLSTLTSNLSSFELRTFDPEGIIFYGYIGEDNWFVLGIRDHRLEVQMSNNNGQMVLSKWGPDISDGKWRKITVDSTINTIEVRVNGEIVVMLTHHVKNDVVAPDHATLDIILGDLPANRVNQLLRPMLPSLDACMRNWAWVKKNTYALDTAMETDENRRCFEREEKGAFFPAHGFAIFKPATLPPQDSLAWHLSIRLVFRVVEDGGDILALRGAGNFSALTISLDNQNQALKISLLDKLDRSVTFPEGVSFKEENVVHIQIESSGIVVETAVETHSIDIPATDFKALEDVWRDPDAYVSVGSIAGHLDEGTSFSGCLEVSLQGTKIDLDSAQYKHPHVRSHSCPVAKK